MSNPDRETAARLLEKSGEYSGWLLSERQQIADLLRRVADGTLHVDPPSDHEWLRMRWYPDARFADVEQRAKDERLVSERQYARPAESPPAASPESGTGDAHNSSLIAGSTAFEEALRNPPAPNAALRKLMAESSPATALREGTYSGAYVDRLRATAPADLPSRAEVAGWRRAYSLIAGLPPKEATSAASLLDAYVSGALRTQVELDAAVAAERERCLAAVEAEPELPGEPDERLVSALEAHPVDVLRATVGVTKSGIAKRIRAAAPPAAPAPSATPPEPFGIKVVSDPTHPPNSFTVVDNVTKERVTVTNVATSSLDAARFDKLRGRLDRTDFRGTFDPELPWIIHAMIDELQRLSLLATTEGDWEKALAAIGRLDEEVASINRRLTGGNGTTHFDRIEALESRVAELEAKPWT